MSRVGVITDIHLGHPSVNKQSVLDGLREARATFEEYDVPLTIVLGDMVHETEDPSRDRDNLKQIYEILNRGMHKPAVMTPGNHDALAFESIHNNSRYMVDRHKIGMENNVTICVVDTAFNTFSDNTGLLGEEYINYLEDSLHPDDYNILATHFPLVYTDKYQESEFFGEYPEAVFALDKYHYEQANLPIDAHWFGHLHLDDTFIYGDNMNNIIFAPFMDIAGDMSATVAGTHYIVDVEERVLTKFPK